MPARKISDLAAAATPLTGAELLPAVQTGASVRMTVADLRAGCRPILTADRTYYVSPSGSDANDGRTSAAAFATRQKAWDTVAALDLNGRTVTIQLADGTYTATMSATNAPVGAGGVVFAGNPTSPANVVISTTAADCYTFPTSMMAVVTIQDQKLQTTTSGSGVQVVSRIWVNVTNLKYGAFPVNTSHVVASIPGAFIVEHGNSDLGGNFGLHASAISGGRVSMSGCIHTITGALSCTNYVLCNRGGIVNANGMTFNGTGSVTGGRYQVQRGGIVDTGTDTGAGANVNYFPGSTAGVSTIGGNYW
jgi:hypothetical protein